MALSNQTPVGYGARSRGWGLLQKGARDVGWMQTGTCRVESIDHNVFFPDTGTGVTVAARVCERCPVRIICLEYALKNNIDHGIWGGLSERARRRLKRSRRDITERRILT